MKMKKLKLDTKPLKSDLKKVLAFIRNHWIVIITFIGAVLILLAIRGIDAAIQTGSDQDVYLEELATYQNIVFDEDVIQEIVKLTANEVDIRADLPENRDNPFLDF